MKTYIVRILDLKFKRVKIKAKTFTIDNESLVFLDGETIVALFPQHSVFVIDEEYLIEEDNSNTIEV